jgi:putative Mn2+ efflux pump MntP
MKKLNFSQMEVLYGGQAIATSAAYNDNFNDVNRISMNTACQVSFDVIAIGVGVLGTAYTAGTAAWAMFGLAAYISAFGYLCPKD